MATIINNSKDAYEAIKPLISRAEQEEVFIIALGSNNNVKSVKLAAIGDIDATVFPKRYIYQQLCIDGASQAILAHTHPSGNPKPSKADIKATRELQEGLKTLGIALCDHIIIGDGKFFSFDSDSVFTF